jgi:putative chitinase
MNAEQLQKICPDTPERLIKLYLPHILETLAEFEIGNVQRQACFLAQVIHESGGFRYMREIWGPTEAQRKYENRHDLGNTKIGDGQRYKGRGAIQLTGRANYKKYGDMLGIDLEAVPDRAESADVAFRIAGLFWKEHDLNELADEGRFETITRRINGGTNGLAHRKELYEKALEVLTTWS